ncbi:hypothetical protein EPUS_08356 [Endocarpon pusillum Z07020]|uniref:Uncharacterized protein n=1 Tax=Endocarpon pusillum (strain Z07020 / HMAS-L-300199) TaxID=1263415 RepID=U1GFC3_ENDPU|nr:uncharacterized protein EPUS_08356 [Endocarpon pusillum Z07020]ERF70798.1 hypothetical protein EPUS_08356 [Endocarpon pusillum Z07020]
MARFAAQNISLRSDYQFDLKDGGWLGGRDLAEIREAVRNALEYLKKKFHPAWKTTSEERQRILELQRDQRYQS